MKKLIVISFIIFYVCALTSCDKDTIENQTEIKNNEYFITKQEATSIASTLEFNSKAERNKKLASSTKTIDTVLTVPDSSGINAFYIFNYHEGGFIIISGDKRSQPILAYSNENNFDFSNREIPSGLLWWLEEATINILKIRNNSEEGSTNNHSTKELYEPCPMQMAISENISLNSKCGGPNPGEEPNCNDIHNYYGPLIGSKWYGPLIGSKWSQWSGFNNYLPNMGCESYQGKPPSGCVATAIGQVMRYYQYPNSYVWQNMPLTSAGSNEISQLLKDIGTAVQMNYNCTGSGAHTENGVDALKNIFDYSSASYGTWNHSTVKGEIISGRPVILAGYNDKDCFLWWCGYEDGHAWVCEGFRSHYYCELGIQSTYYYMNWGWGGSYNGYYGYNSWNPSTFNFKYNKRMLYNIKP